MYKDLKVTDSEVDVLFKIKYVISKKNITIQVKKDKFEAKNKNTTYIIAVFEDINSLKPNWSGVDDRNHVSDDYGPINDRNYSFIIDTSQTYFYINEYKKEINMEKAYWKGWFDGDKVSGFIYPSGNTNNFLSDTKCKYWTESKSGYNEFQQPLYIELPETKKPKKYKFYIALLVHYKKNLFQNVHLKDFVELSVDGPSKYYPEF
jgi:hypothetical protein